MVEDSNQGPDEPEATELVEAEPEETSPDNHHPSEELERVATYTVTENGVTYKVIPQIRNVETNWTLWAFGAAQGPLKFPKGITNDQAEHLGLSPTTQNELNDTLRAAREHGELPPEFRGQPHDQRHLNDLQESLGMQ